MNTITHSKAPDHVELDPNVIGNGYSWHAVIAYLWKNYKEDHPDALENGESSDDEDIDRTSIRRRVKPENVELRWDTRDFVKWLRSDYETELRKRLRWSGVVAMCYNCADDSSRYRINFILTPTSQTQDPVLWNSQLEAHYRILHKEIHKHFRSVSNLYQTLYKFVSIFCQIFITFD